jgi:hypothetical protein
MLGFGSTRVYLLQGGGMGKNKRSRVIFRKWFTGTILAALVMGLLLLPGVSWAITPNPKALAGLKGVYVLIEVLNPQAERLGLTKDQIKTDVELRLLKAGVRVLTEEEQRITPGKPSLYVNINTHIEKDLAVIPLSIRIDLNEIVTLATGIKTIGTIWHTGSVGVVGKKSIKKIRDAVNQDIDRFINDYLAANRKRQGN